MESARERQQKNTTIKEAPMPQQSESPLRNLVRALRAAHRRSADEWIRHMEVPVPPRRPL